MEVTAGVPQGSVLGPTLWNILYDGILRIPVEEGVELTAYADDLAATIRASDVRGLNRKTKETVDKIVEWMIQHDLVLAAHKTEALVLRGPFKRGGIRVMMGGTVVPLAKTLTYLGIVLDGRGHFGPHVKSATEKADRRAAALTRILPNVGGPSEAKRRMLLQVVHSTILYGAQIWHRATQFARYRSMLEISQRRILLRVASAYKTVSAKALQVATATPPMYLLVLERKRIAETLNATTTDRNRERGRTISSWQTEWDGTTQCAQWTKRLIPNLETWIACTHRRLSYFITQFLTGHGSFRSYTKRIGKHNGDECIYCGIPDSVEHTIFRCRRWQDVRQQHWGELMDSLRPENIITKMVESPSDWDIVSQGIVAIMKTKEEEERRHQQENARPQRQDRP